MSKIKWKYDKKFKMYYFIETHPYSNDGMSITKLGPKDYKLHMDSFAFSPRFQKLSSAKQVAELLKNG